MPHYKDGTEARIGDVIKGRGYNVPHDVIGVLVDIRAGATCNLSVSCVANSSQLVATLHKDTDTGVLRTVMSTMRAEPITEYGQADAFELVYRQPAK